MVFVGIKSKKERQQLIDYLRDATKKKEWVFIL
jgi:cytochrome c2